MRPGDIGPHPASPDYYIAMGRPRDMTEDECITLMVRLVGATGDCVQEVPVRIMSVPSPDDMTVRPGFVSEWYPEPEDIDRIVAGQPLRMLVLGSALPPTNLWVRGEDEI